MNSASRRLITGTLAAAVSCTMIACNGCGNGDARENANGNQSIDPVGNANTNDNGGAGNRAAVNGLVEVPDPLSGDNPVFSVGTDRAPGAGQSVHDSDFGTTQTRVTQSDQLRHAYSRYDAFNSDQSMIILHHIMEGDYLVYRTNSIPYDHNDNLVTAIDLEEPRWDPGDPNVIWGLRDFSILTLAVQTTQYTTVKDFSQDATVAPVLSANPDLYRITRHFEGESSRDRRFWALLIQGSAEDYRDRYIVTWDAREDTVLGLYALSAAESLIDWVGMSPNGTWALIGGDWDNGGNLGPGLVMANRELTEFHQIGAATAHADVALDSDGNEVIVMQSTRTDHIDLIPLERATQAIPESASYDGTHHVRLMRLFYDSESAHTFNSGVHISCNVPGYCVVSTYIEAGLSASNWLDRQIVLVELDTDQPRVFHLAKVYGTNGAYWEETHASITNNGSRVIWATNWNERVGDERVWVMQLDLPDEFANTSD